MEIKPQKLGEKECFYSLFSSKVSVDKRIMMDCYEEMKMTVDSLSKVYESITDEQEAFLETIEGGMKSGFVNAADTIEDCLSESIQCINDLSEVIYDNVSNNIFINNTAERLAGGA